MDDLRKQNIEAVSTLVEGGDVGGLREFLEPLHPADIAEILVALGNREKVVVLKQMGKEKAAEVLTEVDEHSGQALLELLTDSEVVSLLKEMPSDDAADLIATLPPEKSRDIDALLPADEREKLRELVGFGEETAGGIMEVERAAVRAPATIQDAIDLVRELADEIEHIQTVYVIDKEDRLLGAIPVLDLLLHDPSAQVTDVMEENAIAVPVEMDQEEVAALFGKYDEFTLPVVDSGGRLVGRITVDDIIDVIEEEASEDIAKMAGTDEEEFGETSPVRISRARLPWLIVGMLGESVNAIIMSRFEASIQTIVTLAFFIPLVIGTAGNTGTQAAIVAVREIALGQYTVVHIWRRLFKELQVTILNGFVLGTLLFVIVLVWRDEPGLGLLMAGSLICVTMVAAIMGASVPLILHRMRIDPAIATGPFITVSNDILGLFIYLSLATTYIALVSGG